jgi:hypothetical protein
MTRRHLESDHDHIVLAVAKHLTGQNFTEIKADVPNFVSPLKVTWKDTGDGHIPDLTGRDPSGHLYVFEVETEDTIRHSHSASQWKLFSAYARQFDASFYVVVPGGCGRAAKAELDRLNLMAGVLEA